LLIRLSRILKLNSAYHGDGELKLQVERVARW
jgi:hypothetical protein